VFVDRSEIFYANNALGFFYIINTVGGVAVFLYEIGKYINYNFLYLVIRTVWFPIYSIYFINFQSNMGLWERRFINIIRLMFVGLRCLEPIKNLMIHQGDTKLNPAKILEQTLIREILSYSFSSTYWMLPFMLSIWFSFVTRMHAHSLFLWWSTWSFVTFKRTHWNGELKDFHLLEASLSFKQWY
jgi:hypothetical protein